MRTRDPFAVGDEIVVQTPTTQDTPALSRADLERLVAADAVDTVVVAVVDMQGRLQGKRMAARYFLDEIWDKGTDACSYLLAVDVDMNTVDGYELSSWDSGYGDFVLKPDLSTLRFLPWHGRTALVMADILTVEGGEVAPSPRQILRHQLRRLADRGWQALVGTELEFLVFREPYEQAWSQGYRGLTSANQYNVDYSILGTSRVEPLLHKIRRGMAGAGMYVESAKGECNPGQHEITFRYAEALVTCDNHSIYKTGAKEIASQEGLSLTFMAKYDEREGNSCHIHVSLCEEGGRPLFPAGDGPDAGVASPLMEHFIAGQLAGLREMSLFFAPHINSYKRFVPGSFAPTAVSWGHDNRTCAIRTLGAGRGLRMENRLPGGDVNPYLAVAAILAAGLHGIDAELPLEAPLVGNGYASGAPTVPSNLRDALELWEKSDLARTAFGDEVVAHYANNARIELASFGAAVTDWERIRGYERL
ncbi:MAG TPA: glutamine synthetase family protein [Euzebya sp.]|nr:glutamine synthetase family protein [Euzebya sp.]